MNGKAMRSVDSISESEEINDHPDNHTMDSSSDGRSAQPRTQSLIVCEQLLAANPGSLAVV